MATFLLCNKSQGALLCFPGNEFCSSGFSVPLSNPSTVSNVGEGGCKKRFTELCTWLADLAPALFWGHSEIFTQFVYFVFLSGKNGSFLEEAVKV